MRSDSSAAGVPCESRGVTSALQRRQAIEQRHQLSGRDLIGSGKVAEPCILDSSAIGSAFSRMNILITGVSSGFGRAIARRGDGRGHTVIGTVRSERRRASSS